MPRHPNSLQFGFFLTPTAGSYPELLKLAQLCDRLGLDLIGVQDHPYQARYFDTWTLIAALAVQTEKIRFFPDVANLPLRLPSLLAKAAASLDQMTGGRIELGIGAGFFWEGIKALGGPQRSPGGAVDALEEAIQVIRLIWSGQRGVRFEGRHYPIKGAHAGPEPAHPIGIWVGAIQERMLALTGRLGDGWVPSSSYVQPDQLIQKNRSIDEAAEQAGRLPGDIRRIYNLFGKITGGQSESVLKGPVDQWIDELRSLSNDHGMDTFIFGPEEPSEEQIRLFAEQVVPAVRES
jgi:alkanesulfonate monooxygenase SsuD/methylene tetrahydromethanopterin reductase-like flavin-dependent oxidoreductase (luciferase family)